MGSLLPINSIVSGAEFSSWLVLFLSEAGYVVQGWDEGFRSL